MTPEQQLNRNAYQRAYQKKWVARNREKVRMRRKAARTRNVLKISTFWREYYAKNRDRLCARSRTRAKKNRSSINARRRFRYVNDFGFRMVTTLRNRMSAALKAQKCAKTSLLYELVGCSKEQLTAHIQNLFSDGMSWANYGEWHIDHKLPCVMFDLSIVAEQKRCFHFSNLQPLWAKDNYCKSARV